MGGTAVVPIEDLGATGTALIVGHDPALGQELGELMQVVGHTRPARKEQHRNSGAGSFAPGEAHIGRREDVLLHHRSRRTSSALTCGTRRQAGSSKRIWSWGDLSGSCLAGLVAGQHQELLQVVLRRMELTG